MGDQWLELRQQLLISRDKRNTLSRARLCVCVFIKFYINRATRRCQKYLSPNATVKDPPYGASVVRIAMTTPNKPRQK